VSAPAPEVVRCTLSLDGRDVEGRGTPARREAVLLLPTDLTRGEVWYLVAGLARTVEGLRALLDDEGAGRVQG
jgi:hypothetical protein